MRVQPDHLAALAAAVDGGSLETAARALHVTPSAVSQRLRALESAAGAVLLVRSRPVRVTDAGAPYLRLARQLAALVEEATRQVDDPLPSIPLAVNADSLSTWVLPALATVADRVRLDVLHHDEAHTPALLRSGEAMAAVTSDPVAVQGCLVEPLGTMRYRPMAAPGFAERWFAGGAGASGFAAAPLVDFDRLDALQTRLLERLGVDSDAPPRHRVPGSKPFTDAIRLGIGWGLISDLERDADPRIAELVVLGTETLDVPLWWQQWAIDTPGLGLVAAAVRTAAATALQPSRRAG